MANPHQYWNHKFEEESRHSMAPNSPTMSSPERELALETHRKSSAVSSRAPSIIEPGVCTRSIGGQYGTAIVFERYPAARSDDDLIMITVKLSNKLRQDSFDSELPARPAKRSFLRRLSTRISSSHGNEDQYKAIKIPRGDYKRYFARDHNGHYAGTEPEQEWDESDLQRAFGEYQDRPLRFSFA